MSWILTASGRHVNLLRPEPEQIDIRDIATALSRECRFSGQTRLHYSVAQHSVVVSRYCVGYELEGLMHDAPEAYLRDIPEPLKELLGRYVEIESNIYQAIRARYGMPMEIPLLQVRKIDLRVLAAERRDLMPQDDRPWPCLAGVRPVESRIHPWSIEESRTAFLEKFFDLLQQSQIGSGGGV
jgi:uncharacterized protein